MKTQRSLKRPLPTTPPVGSVYTLHVYMYYMISCCLLVCVLCCDVLLCNIGFRHWVCEESWLAVKDSPSQFSRLGTQGPLPCCVVCFVFVSFWCVMGEGEIPFCLS